MLFRYGDERFASPHDDRFRKVHWWQLRELKQDRAFLLKNGNAPRSQELLPVVEAEIARLRASQIKFRYPHIFKDEA